MSSTPKWAPVDVGTSSLLSLVANDQMHPRPEEEWNTYLDALRAAADWQGIIRPNALRPLVRGKVAPRRIGAFANRALSEGIVAYTGEWQVSDDHQGRNGGKPQRIMRLVGGTAA